MGRAPCCEKIGLKRGAWTREEDQKLIDYINQNGHVNWRSLPKHAGLLRCGKSCRLRWTNYLRPDIKRGNFTKEEEDNIIELQGVLGNRWSAIAAKLPGRTDNEIKNVWHTHLKKKQIKQVQPTTPETKHYPSEIPIFHEEKEQDQKPVNFPTIQTSFEAPAGFHPNSPQHSSSDFSSVTTGEDSMKADALDNFPEMDENFWSEVFSDENSDVTSYFPVVNGGPQLQIPPSPHRGTDTYMYGHDSSFKGDMDFWYDLFTRAEELPE